MPWRYIQSTGQLFHDTALYAVGYSGHAHGLNNPACEHLPDIGPIPAGAYDIGKVFTHQTKGPVCMRLTPHGHDALGRSGFLIHGDNSKLDRSASHGCIILQRMVREHIAVSMDRVLVVEI